MKGEIGPPSSAADGADGAQLNPIVEPFVPTVAGNKKLKQQQQQQYSMQQYSMQQYSITESGKERRPEASTRYGSTAREEKIGRSMGSKKAESNSRGHNLAREPGQEIVTRTTYKY